ncbi:single-stranded-DNA-specific exonuclease RecJ [Patescibacteria group bacterium]|nr:single-stranded-DNA-specific exonuclease RecJ [Patescibacteria group bacterium]MBU4452647.1 single-stranded-DNA-specific exonuclease RecJ [Patescibacteria group bacterium]MCG2687488.1 single-stranded-DNA-specific exonuclease RecJ [Candidatus Parcubacteria bacterium]
MNRVWQIQPRVSDDIVLQLLHNRSISSQNAEVFLNPDYDRDLHDPFLFLQMQTAVDRVLIAIEKSEKIVVHGDYDADGICGSTLIMDVLKHVSDAMGVELNASVFLPHRERDGYGVASHTVDQIIKDKTSLLITVDCGISNAKELDAGEESGLDVIICDHHQLAEQLPKFAVIIHPLAPGENYSNKKLCGTGVAFKFACALLICARERGIKVGDGYEKWLLDLVAIATVTDIVPLLGENRALEKFGLKVLNRTRRPGLLKIIQNANLELGKIKTDDIGFRIGPRLNAAGRLKDASVAFDALNAKTQDEADSYSKNLEMLNRERQRISDFAFQEAKQQIIGQEARYAHVVWSDSWTPGILGLVAGKIANEFNVSTFALSKSGDQFIGSGRSANGLHLVEAMRACGDIFIKAGGHPEACGLTLESLEMVEIFSNKVNAYAEIVLKEKLESQEFLIDAQVDVKDINFEFYKNIMQFEPFGTGNPTPVFALENATVGSIQAIGSEGKHLRLRLEDNGSALECIGFGFGKYASQLKIGSTASIAFKLRVNEWNGNTKLQAEIADIVIK